MNLALISILAVVLSHIQPRKDTRKTRERFYIVNLLIIALLYIIYSYIQIKRNDNVGVTLATLLLLYTFNDIVKYVRDV